MNDSLARFIAGLAPTPPHWGGTGALRLQPDPRDYRVIRHPAVQAVLEAGVPDSASIRQWVTGPPYNQGAEGACVAASTCGACSTDDKKNKGVWTVFDWQELYHEAGGTGQNGVDSRLVLDICKSRGTPEPGGQREPVVTGYSFVSQTPGQFRQEVKACIAAGFPVVFAWLLPTDMGWQCGNGPPTTGYHQTVGIEYDATWLVFLNSWGAWGLNGTGIGSVRWDYLEANGLQLSYCYAYTTAGSGPSPPPPPPATLCIAGYRPPVALSGGIITIFGMGFAADALAAWGTTPLLTQYASPTDLTAKLPLSTGTAPIHVRSGGKQVTGPLLTVEESGPSPPPPPPPSGRLVLQLSSPPLYHRALAVLSMHETTGQFPPAGTRIEVAVTTPDNAVTRAGLTLS